MSPASGDVARFRALHAPGQLLVLPNVWDAVSARLVEAVGGVALATSSAAVAWARGAPDGERLPFDQVLAATRDIVRAVHVPVSVDFERGYATSPAGVADAICRLAEVGVVGVNLEDGTEPPEVLAAKLSAAREALQRQGLDMFLNARADVILRRMLSGSEALDEVVRRGKRYVEAGCDGFFVPGLAKPEELVRIAEEVRVPLNVWAASTLAPVEQLRAMGVRRISVGPRLALAALSAARRDAEQLLAGRWAPTFDGPMLTYPEVNRWFE
ncbi:isocitrate lyase/phosphoenolpyruvate mutase family protein [Vitiosangium sp. GDMCC 1.1324]|uniref:isocitrate lyase/PEP mutase family protein n=1 Tax=Vitiosangium sp. (strain GDMCC 1.1324) TaxID=2138576 RepID=UPI000D334452|nr:isocitrate lyase/phosphoenolpyruvate mutase family protein [Vitiosangium sp. GDMCC 1.1324]PTL80306.1 isocitrate lyase/phosphoenolpyruvate mutase family protein [Vitiosangium sp. GDMCC 1.1324]